MLIGLDLDGVMMDWDGYLDSQLDLVPELATFPRQPERGWNDYKTTSPEHKKLVYKILEHPEFYGSLEPIPGAFEAAKQMRADGHDVVFVSSPWASNPSGFQAKADSLYKHAGSWGRSNLILTADKTMIELDVLVDDKPVIKGRFQTPSWVRAFYSHSYNEGLAGPRIENWTDGSWKDILYGLEEGM